MRYGFDTPHEDASVAALLVYAVYRSRNQRRYKIRPDMWGQIEKFVEGAAKRATSIPLFVQAFKGRMCCESLQPRWLTIGHDPVMPILAYHDEEGRFTHAIQRGTPERREFLTRIFDHPDQRGVLRRLYREPVYVIALVKDRLERERPIEADLEHLDTLETTDA